ncbi:helix-turn-helix domain-containing protein [Campylobacter coli]|uniref:XRE family transcriptional regulator n=1 Tax=Campylobacter coli TaxID=195 RepID=UPI0002581F74|nr:LexA family transcriptional regulator [Campylobacter coli]EBF5696053.1 LexA family transcriptional regulator [Campylobacter jejuni]EAH4874488.1 LexA family transcriptional regulator [Campylobacter coli]EAH5920336.1 LexA family transcriptional regulator [Campylobacter coli]EAH6000425.1 LexA family transcriptional regulator [Campylobacter coli]EAH6374591.1 LexA family transcriptional regulator [Campylobacter coli]
MEIGKKIRIAREEHGYSQEQLASELGITTRTLQNYEYGKSDVGVILITKIANILKISSDYFFKDDSSLIVRKSLNKNVRKSFVSNKKMSVSQTKLKETEKESFYYIPKLNISASAGGGNELEGLECYESGELMAIDKAFFKTPPSASIKAIRVDGYSMTPMLFPDSWVIFEESADFKGDGLYVLNYNGQLMVKLLQLNPFENILEIISVNKEYKSYSIKLDESQTPLFIKGKVLRSVI